MKPETVVPIPGSNMILTRERLGREVSIKEKMISCFDVLKCLAFKWDDRTENLNYVTIQ